MKLPIDEHKPAIVAALARPEPLVVEAPTGSGKSTRLPVWMAEALPRPVLVVEPRRVACRSLAGFLASERGEPVGRSVGYRVRFEDKSSPDTRILFVTPGVALRMLRGSARDAQGSARANRPLGGEAAPAGALDFSVVLDEFHERSWETDLLATLLLHRRQAEDRPPPLVITSATLDGARLAESLGGWRLLAEGRSFPVAVEHAAEPWGPSGVDLEDRVVDAVRRLEEPGDVLVFLPGKGEIRKARAALARAGLDARYELLEVHGSLPSQALERAFRPVAERPRLYLSTNVAETSVTLPGVTVVVDSGLVRQTLHRGGRTALALVAASAPSLTQRAGRAGRVAPGRCVRLFSTRFTPDASVRPEVERVELDDLVVQAAACGLPASRLAGAPWPSPLPRFALERAHGRLTERGVLDEEGALTSTGQKLAELPVSASSARALLQAPPALAGAVADVVALMQRDSDLFLRPEALPPTSRDDVLAARAELLARARSDLEAQLLALRLGEPRRHGLHDSALVEARRTATLLRGLIGADPPEAGGDATPLPDRDELAGHLAQRMPELAWVLRPRAIRGKGQKDDDDGPRPWANGEDEVLVRPFRAPHDDDARREEPDAGLILSQVWIGDPRGRTVRGYGRLLLPCSRAALARAGCGEEVVGEPRLVRTRAGPKLQAQVTRVLAGVVLEEVERPLEGPEVVAAAASLILAGRLLAPAGARVLDQLHAWRTAAALERSEGRSLVEPPEPEVWTAERLATLGVERGDDLALLDPADLEVDLAAHLGLATDELERVAADFPRLWIYDGVSFAVRLEHHPRRVLLEPLGGGKGPKKPPPAQVVPRFRGWPVWYRKASRLVPLR